MAINNLLVLVLDVDGVITNPVEKRVTEEKIFTQIIEELESGNIVTLNTGRSNSWMIERVINPLIERLKDKSLLKNFFAVGEKGLTWVGFDPGGRIQEGVFDKKGKAIEGFDLSVFLDTDTAEHFKTLENEARELIKNNYSHSTFFDNSKKAMISTEMIDGHNHEEYASEQKDFTNELKKIINSLGLDGKFNVDPTTIATDIQLPNAGKHLGAGRILDWLSSKNIVPNHFIAIGDSISDLEMADELNLRGKSVDFYYVNPKKPINIKKPYPIFNSTKEFGNGTLEVLEGI